MASRSLKEEDNVQDIIKEEEKSKSNYDSDKFEKVDFDLSPDKSDETG